MKATVRGIGSVGALLILALGGQPVNADPVATGTLTQTVQGTSSERHLHIR